MRLLDLSDLREMGIKYSRQHLHRLVKANKFPAPVKLGENRNAWIEAEINAYLEARVTERDAAKEQAA